MPTHPPVMVRGEAVWPVVCATLVRDIQAKMPEDDDEPDDEPEDQPDDESEDDPGTLYFGQKDGWPVPIPAEVQHHALYVVRVFRTIGVREQVTLPARCRHHAARRLSRFRPASVLRLIRARRSTIAACRPS